MISTTENISSRGHAYGVKHLLAPFPGPLADILSKTLSLDQNQTQFLLDLGAIYLNEKRLTTKSSCEIQKDDYLRVHQQPRRFPVEIFKYSEAIIFEDSEIIIVNKVSGLPVHPTVDNTEENLLTLLEKARGEKLFITHRLDTATAGLMVYAKNAKAQTAINQMLVHGEVKKYYRALVQGHDLQEGEWLHYMEPSPRAPKKVSVAPMMNWAECKLNLIDQTPMTHSTYGDISEVLIELVTGRTHQIRAQLSHEGFPIIGDKAYGSKIALESFESICLQSSFLQLPSLTTAHEILSQKLDARPWSNLFTKA